MFKKITFLYFLCISSVFAGADTKIIDAFFKDLVSLSADYSQSVQNAQLSTIDRADGVLWILRPGKFRWNYTTPYLQEIVSNGKKIWIYDADLEQVTIKPIDETMGNTPALLLSSTKPISDTFTIHASQENFGLIWFELVPKETEAGFTNIQLGFKDNVIEEMLLKDNLGQVTRLVFKNVKRNPEINKQLFEFVAPPNVDVFDTTPKK